MSTSPLPTHLTPTINRSQSEGPSQSALPIPTLHMNRESKLGTSEPPFLKKSSPRAASLLSLEDDQGYGDPSFYQQLSIKIDQHVSAMSISPSKRDIVLASRNGLLIFDLECPFDAPRALPYFSRWEVSETQWNPHPCRDTWIATTINHKCLIWNLMRPKLSSVEFELSGHDRAISDVNWSNVHPEMLGTASLDTSVKLWDLRQSPDRCVQSLINWDLAISQIDFHPRRDHIIATAQETSLRVWDTRKGSVPLLSIDAHQRKIANINWSPTLDDELLTCSYDGTIKFWDTSNLTKEKGRIETGSPVGKARYTPFGRGIINIPLRSENSLFLWDQEQSQEPVFQYKGHTGIVKEFLWRIRGFSDTCAEQDDREFQLVTFSKDRQLRLWPIGNTQLKAVGHHPCYPSNDTKSNPNPGFSYRTPRHSVISMPSPISHLSSGWARRPSEDTANPPLGSSPVGSYLLSGSTLPRSTLLPMANILPPTQPARFNILTEHTAPLWIKRARYGSHDRTEGLSLLPKGWVIKSLMDEFAMIKQHFKERKVEFERVDVPGRSCRIALPVSWAKDGVLATIRVSIEFPSDYPSQAPPSFDLARQGTISMANRGAIADSLQKIARAYAVKGMPCLFPCISYLLGDKPFDEGAINRGDSDNSDEESKMYSKLNQGNGSDDLGFGLEREEKNIPFPRLCGGVFGPDGKVIVFYSSIVSSQFLGGSVLSKQFRNPYRQTHPRSYQSLGMYKMARGGDHFQDRANGQLMTVGSDDPDDILHITDLSSLYYRPNSHVPSSLAVKKPNKSLFIPGSDQLAQPSLPLRQHSGNSIIIKTYPSYCIPDKDLAQGYILYDQPLPIILTHNRRLARSRGRKDLAKLWKLIYHILLFKPLEPSYLSPSQAPIKDPILTSNLMEWGGHPFGQKLVRSLFEHYEVIQDYQTLGILACVFDSLVLRERVRTPEPSFKANNDPISYNLSSETPRDYFNSGDSGGRSNLPARSTGSLNRRLNFSSLGQIPLGSLQELPSPLRKTPKPLKLDFSATIPSPIKTTPLPLNSSLHLSISPSAIPRSFKNFSLDPSRMGSHLHATSLDHHPGFNFGSSTFTRPGHDLYAHDSSSGLKMEDMGTFREDTFEGPGSYSTTHSYDTSLSYNISFSHPINQSSVSNLVSHNGNGGHVPQTQPPHPFFDKDQELRYSHYRMVYADMLYRWNMLVKRAELLKGISDPCNPDEHIGLILEPANRQSPTSPKLVLVSPDSISNIRSKSKTFTKCVICNVYVKGISTFCDICGHGGHFDHMNQWFQPDSAECPAGCGCQCLSIRDALTEKETQG